MSRPSRRSIAVAAAILTLLLAGVFSYYASRAPDGLSRVAADKGIDGQPRAHRNAPLDGYSAKGIGDAHLSRGVAGVTGAATVALLAGGLGYAVRRRERRRG